MKPEWKAAWLAALRSGDYEQCSGVLISPYPSPSYCCLGVLAKIAGRDPERGACVSVALLKDSIARAVGLPRVGQPEDLDEVSCRNAQRRLAEMNDNGLSFSEIADWIEGNL